MKRAFLIEEIMLDGVSGQVRGHLEIDPDTGTIQQVSCDLFSFRSDTTECLVVLSPAQRQWAIEIVHRVMGAQHDLLDDSGQLISSAESYSPRSSVAASTRILGRYLGAGGRGRPETGARRRAQ